MEKILIDSEIVSELKVDGDWYSIKHGTLTVGDMVWVGEGGQAVEAGTLGFSFEIYGSQAMVVAGPLSSITAVRYTRPL